MNKEALMGVVQQKLSGFLEREVSLEELGEPYYELGADSMDLVVLAYELEEVLKCEISPEIFIRHNTIEEVIDQLSENSPEGPTLTQ